MMIGGKYMIAITKELPVTIAYPLENIGSPEDILFFDIETTGFSGNNSIVYLIGCTYLQKGIWYLKQWFADNPESELDLLHSFFDFLTHFSILVHFNGDTFDLPYLMKRCARYGLSYHFNHIESYDIYKKIKPYKKLLHLENVKQKTLEKFLGIDREDLFSGGQLIPVYEEFLLSGAKEPKNLLLLHNEDDIKGMPAILSILSYPDFRQGNFSCISQKKAGQDLLVSGISSISIPVPFSFQSEYWEFTARKQSFQVTIQLYEGICKYFYPNYKDYYYLTLEDQAIHKSLAEFIDKEHKKKATARTCYTKFSSCFIPEKKPVFTPALKNDYGDKHYYTPYQAHLFEDQTIFSEYIRHILDSTM